MLTVITWVIYNLLTNKAIERLAFTHTVGVIVVPYLCITILLLTDVDLCLLLAAVNWLCLRLCLFQSCRRQAIARLISQWIRISMARNSSLISTEHRHFDTPSTTLSRNINIVSDRTTACWQYSLISPSILLNILDATRMILHCNLNRVFVVTVCGFGTV